MLDALWKPAVATGQFVSDDLDEVREFMDGHNGVHWRHARKPSPIGFRLAHHDGEFGKFAWCSMAARQTIRGSVASATAHLTLGGRSSYRMGRRDFETGPGDLVILPPDRDLTIEAESLRRFAIQMPFALAGEAAPAGILRFSLPANALAALVRVIGDVDFAASLPTARRSAALAHVEPRLADWLRARVPVKEGRRTPRLAPERVRLVEEWIDAHLHEPLSLARLCDRAGVGARCLQVAFESHRQQSPMEFVAERRLVAAHAALSRGEGESVTAVASALGFEHPGRFAAGYRRLFGLAPSEMRRRANVGR